MQGTRRTSPITLMQIQELIFCPQHKRGFIVLEDTTQRLTLAFAVRPDEAPRLARIMTSSQHAVHPLYDFIQALLETFLVTPTDVPWRFILFQGEAHQVVSTQLAAVYAAQHPESSERNVGTLAKLAHLFTYAPLVVAVVSRADPTARKPEWEKC
jgi:hypothetical protein